MNLVSTPSNDPGAATPCPRCQKPLIDPTGLGWCRACGYCRSLAESAQTLTAAEVPAGPSAISATGSAITDLPAWFWILFGGAILVAVGTFAANRYVSLTPFGRATFATIQIAAGLGAMFLGQFIGLLRLAPEDSTLTFKDAVFPFRLYGLALKRLPTSALTLYLGVWGLTAIVAAGFFVGGLDHWLEYLPKKQGAPNVSRVK